MSIRIKSLAFILSFVCLSNLALSQVNEGALKPMTTDQRSVDFLQYRPRWNLKIGAGLGTTWRQKENFLDASALSISAEPSFRLSNYVALGLRGEYTIMKSYMSNIGRVKSDPIGSISATADVIKLWNNNFAPFIGLGAGAYFLGTGVYPVSTNPTQEGVENVKQNLGTRFGISPRIGVNLMAFSVAVEIHLIDEKVWYNRDYATLKIGYTL
ncbi:hypothetical protein L0657_24430 [Dyadobacter sp. CY345]|uniref:hypothetical protein n=1 Tax=Dyadobacter sp. CY345 TaxID=2909335 RepID=UPI001F25EF86|nr:hypothetical protein [Dyadobacter sp. CY345]MCF2447124.1 hypothetical protein [Dyadobacter sp. CY345]